MKHRSLDQPNGVLNSIALLMRSVKASAAVILAPLGILLITDRFALHCCKCWSKSKSCVVWLAEIPSTGVGGESFLHSGHANLVICFA